MDSIETRLKEKNISTIEQFHSIEVSSIDEWKDIPVGYRIKLRKYIEHHK
jgi:hypothetical protein